MKRFANNGEIADPCGVPRSRSTRTPSGCCIGAVSHRRTYRRHTIPNPVQVLVAILFELGDRHLVHSGRTLIGLDPLKRLPHHPLGNIKRLVPRLRVRSSSRRSRAPPRHPVESAWGAVPALPPARFPRPLAEPGVRVSADRALHGRCRQAVVVPAQGLGIVVPR